MSVTDAAWQRRVGARVRQPSIMPSRDAQWSLGTVIAIAIALSMQIGGIRADVRELRADVREDLRGIDERLRAVEQAVQPDQAAE